LTPSAGFDSSHQVHARQGVEPLAGETHFPGRPAAALLVSAVVRRCQIDGQNDRSARAGVEGQ
jgi:hypothetical protein